VQYQKFKVGKTFIEFHNSWFGEESVIVNGQVVSRKSSVMGTDHPFTLMENGVRAKYVLTSKLAFGFQVLLDLRRNGKLLFENVPAVMYGVAPRKPKNEAKIKGLYQLKSFELEDAISSFKKALEFDAEDPEIYFHMACAYSVLEKSPEAFECLRLAVEKGLQNTDIILTHDMLAWVRMSEGFEGFLGSNFRKFDKD